jgi:hypothetical protein
MFPVRTSFQAVKNRVRRARFQLLLGTGCAGLVWLTGCQSLQPTAFAPVEARLEPVPGGGAQRLVAVNTSGHVLHHYRFRAYMWDDQAVFYSAGQAPNVPRRMPAMTYTFMSSGNAWRPDEVMRFMDFNIRDQEGTIFYPVSRLQIVGRCDEGRFREHSEMNSSGQLQVVGTNSGPAKPQPVAQP